MKSPAFVHLHVHTEYSLLDGACKIEPLVARAAQLGMPAVALTDHGVMYGVVRFYQACEKHRVKPLIGCEVYVAPRSRFDKSGKVDSDPNHLVLLALDAEGYRNLINIVSASHLEGFYYKPRVDAELLSRHSRGVVALSACVGGEPTALLVQGRDRDARELAGKYRDIFGPDGFFLELQDHGLPEQKKVTPALVALARDLNLPLVATNDVHYLTRADAAVHDVLLCIQTNTTVDDPNRLRFQGEEFYFKDGAEMAALFADYPEALSNTLALAERVDLKLEFGDVKLPHYGVPEGYDFDSYLRHLCEEAIPPRYPGAGPEVGERLNAELEVIRARGLAAYLLIVWDIVHYAKQAGILVGPGRGSAPGSLVLYLLGVTNIDPLRFNIPFERFVNLARLSMPDIDCDFEDLRRGEVIRYVSEKYGADRVAQIITFGTIGPRLAIRDAGRAMRVPAADVDRIAKSINPSRAIARSLDADIELRYEREQSPAIRRLLDTAQAIEGLARHAGTHAAAVVIAPEPLRNLVPLQRATEGEGLMTQFEWEDVDRVGLLKMDILGLRTLSVIRRAIELVEKTRGVHIDLDGIPFDDAKTFGLLARGETAGVFQLESSGMRQVLREMAPDRFEDIIAVVALYRPGPMEQISVYVRRKHGEKFAYLHAKLKGVLKPTYGVMVYQDQVMEVARDLAGFSMTSAEALLNAMRKKKHEVMPKLREEFLRGAKAQGVSTAVAQKTFDQLAEFAGYGFNKAHAASYALNAYQTAYLKANFPPEFMAAQLSSVMDNKDKVAAYIEECRRMELTVLPPDVNESEQDFTVEGATIRFGLAAIKHVSHSAIEAIAKARVEGGPFRDLWDFCRRVDMSGLNRMVMESLARCGAMSGLGGSRAQLLAALEPAMEIGQQSQRDRAVGQVSLFGETAAAELSPSLPVVPEMSREEILAAERELLGFFITAHPVTAYGAELEALGVTRAADIEADRVEEVVVGGVVTSARRHITKTGKPMLFFALEDLSGTIEATMFPDACERSGSAIVIDAVVVARGRVEASYRAEEGEGESRPRLVISAAAPLADKEAVREVQKGGRSSNGRRRERREPPGARPRSGGETSRSPAEPASGGPVHIRMPEERSDDQTLARLRSLIVAHEGDTEVLLHLHLAGAEHRLHLGPKFVVARSEEFSRAVEGLLGDGAVWTDSEVQPKET